MNELEFWNHVDWKNTNGCWIWKGPVSAKGYGCVSFNKTSTRPHRVSWSIFNGPIPYGLSVCHKCDVPLCVNPNHLFLGTQADNNRDMVAKGKCVNLRGSAHGMAKITEKDVFEIRNSLLSQNALSRKYGITQSQIWAIIHHKSWSHI